jgi:hypothetical protein
MLQWRRFTVRFRPVFFGTGLHFLRMSTGRNPIKLIGKEAFLNVADSRHYGISSTLKTVCPSSISHLPPLPWTLPPLCFPPLHTSCPAIIKMITAGTFSTPSCCPIPDQYPTLFPSSTPSPIAPSPSLLSIPPPHLSQTRSAANTSSLPPSQDRGYLSGPPQR